MRSIMLDLETWGVSPGSALRSIGAVEFELDGITGDTFYMNIDEQSCLDAGMTRDPATVEWWEKQSLESREVLYVDPHPILLVIADFEIFWRRCNATFVWSHGGNFDEVLWSAACRIQGITPPWKYWNARCTRTLYQMGQVDPMRVPRQGEKHNALDDALHQVRCAHLAYKQIYSGAHYLEAAAK